MAHAPQVTSLTFGLVGTLSGARVVQQTQSGEQYTYVHAARMLHNPYHVARCVDRTLPASTCRQSNGLYTDVRLQPSGHNRASYG